MILILAIAIGLAAGLARARIADHPYTPPEFHKGWLLVVAVTPQLIAFHLPNTSKLFSDRLAATILIGSQTLLLVFVWANRRLPGMLILLLGFSANFLAIISNGGLMPISPETVQQLLPDATIAASLLGTRLGSSKDILLAVTDTRFWLLSDRFLLPPQIPYSVAFSLGDIFIAIGTFWLLWAQGKIDTTNT